MISNMQAKKSLGQHFLKSERALTSIVDTGKLSSDDTVVEIGPGHGALTERLLNTGARVIAIEKDDELYELLKTKFVKEINSGQLTLVHEDILNFNLDTLPSTYKLVANIPYNITGAILEKFLSEEQQPILMVLLVQKEVAERIVARGGKESILSISVKAYGNPHYIERVLAGSFVPAPSVDSAIIKIDQISKQFFEKFKELDFFKLLKAGFQSKRKKLSSNLSQIFDKSKVKEVFDKLNLDENVRAEDISVDVWQKIGENLI